MLIYKPSTQIPNAFHRNRIAEKLKIIKNDMTLFHVLLSTIDKLFTGKKSSCQFTDQFHSLAFPIQQSNHFSNNFDTFINLF